MTRRIKFIVEPGEEPVQQIEGYCGNCISNGVDSGENSLIWMKSKPINDRRAKYTIRCIVCSEEITGVFNTNE